MKKFYIFAMLAYGLLAIHILEKSLRLGKLYPDTDNGNSQVS